MIATTALVIGAAPTAVWPTVRNLAGWDEWQDAFSIKVDGDQDPAPGVDIFITTFFGFPFGTQRTHERIYKVDVDPDGAAMTIGWEVVALQFGSLNFSFPKFLYSTERCIELTREGDNTRVHNWILYKGLLWPVFKLLTNNVVSRQFAVWNEALVQKYGALASREGLPIGSG